MARKRAQKKKPEKKLTRKQNQRLVAMEHAVLRDWRKNFPNQPACLLAVSGGKDSMVLAEIFYRLQPILKIDLALAHVHHGGERGKQKKFRDRAWRLVKKKAEEWNLPFFSNAVLKKRDKKKGEKLELVYLDPPPLQLISEADCRNFRHQWLEQWQKDGSIQWSKQTLLVFGHHMNDLLETRLIRLMRGTGLQGLKAMDIKKSFCFRPLLSFSSSEVIAYASQQNVHWIEDPSNQKNDYLRNWIRGQWLPSLDNYRKGGMKNLAQSLQRIVEESDRGESDLLKKLLFLDKKTDRGVTRVIDRINFQRLSITEKRRILAAYMLFHKIRGYGQSHIDEIIKRLDTHAKKFKFTLLKFDWWVNAEHFEVISGRKTSEESIEASPC